MIVNLGINSKLSKIFNNPLKVCEKVTSATSSNRVRTHSKMSSRIFKFLTNSYGAETTQNSAYT